MKTFVYPIIASVLCFSCRSIEPSTDEIKTVDDVVALVEDDVRPYSDDYNSVRNHYVTTSNQGLKGSKSDDFMGISIDLTTFESQPTSFGFTSIVGSDVFEGKGNAFISSVSFDAQSLSSSDSKLSQQLRTKGALNTANYGTVRISVESESSNNSLVYLTLRGVRHQVEFKGSVRDENKNISVIGSAEIDSFKWGFSPKWLDDNGYASDMTLRLNLVFQHTEP